MTVSVSTLFMLTFQEFAWKLTPEQINHAKNEFATMVGPGNTLMEGAVAFKALSTSGLPNEDLAKIWSVHSCANH